MIGAKTSSRMREEDSGLRMSFEGWEVKKERRATRRSMEDSSRTTAPV